jgi:L-threonylcarbamoyladenylate synthase
MVILKATPENIRLASRIVNDGGIVVYPTDTVYGLGCNPFDIKAVGTILKIKGREDKPLPVLASNIDKVERIGYLSEKTRKIAKKLWPGPFTLIIPKKRVLSSIVTNNLDSVGVRVPQHRVAIQLISLSNGLLIGTSANKTGKKAPKTANEAAEQIGNEVEIILNGGSVPLGKSSTVVDLTSEKMKILRLGPVAFKI